MLAVAGSKGGTGTTTTALGVAAVASRPTTVVDGDWATPSLATRAGVPTGWSADPTVGDDRTLPARLGRSVPGDGPLDVAGPTRVVPAPDRRTHADPRLGRVLRASSVTDRWTVVDCPSGVGRPTSRALRAADRAVVTTTRTAASVRATRKTVRIARALGTPVVGAVVSELAAAPEATRDALGNELDPPVVATVPAAEGPVFDDESVTAVHRAIVEKLGARDEESCDRSVGDRGS